MLLRFVALIFAGFLRLFYETFAEFELAFSLEIFDGALVLRVFLFDFLFFDLVEVAVVLVSKQIELFLQDSPSDFAVLD